MVTGNGQLRHALRERSAAAARFPHAYGGLLPARPGTPGIYFEYSRKLVTLVGLVCCFLGASGAEEYFFVRAGGPGRPLGAEWPLKKEITGEHIEVHAAEAVQPLPRRVQLKSTRGSPPHPQRRKHVLEKASYEKTRPKERKKENGQPREGWEDALPMGGQADFFSKPSTAGR